MVRRPSRTTRRFLCQRRLSLDLVFLLTAACGGGGRETGVTPPPPGGGNPTPAPVATVVVTGAPPVLEMGSSVTLGATPKDAAGNTLSRAVTWSTSDPAVVAITVDGVATALTPGRSATITATVEGKIGSVSIAVKIPDATAQEVPTPVSVSVPTGVAVVAPDLPLSAGVYAAELTPDGVGTANLQRGCGPTRRGRRGHRRARVVRRDRNPRERGDARQPVDRRDAVANRQHRAIRLTG